VVPERLLAEPNCPVELRPFSAVAGDAGCYQILRDSAASSTPRANVVESVSQLTAVGAGPIPGREDPVAKAKLGCAF
jgi:hypothetical protein